MDLLRRLLSSVNTMSLTGTVSNGVVRCSDAQSIQLFHVIRSCFLCGCRRFPGLSAACDLMFLLIVPEFLGVFACDLDLIAYLCTCKAMSSFASEMFQDKMRTAHFYSDDAIMRDEELILTLVTSLQAIEKLTFLSDSKCLANQRLVASLRNICFEPMTFKDEEQSRRHDAVVPVADLHDGICPQSDEDLFSAFLSREDETPVSPTDGGAELDLDGVDFTEEEHHLDPPSEKRKQSSERGTAEKSDGGDNVFDGVVGMTAWAFSSSNEGQKVPYLKGLLSDSSKDLFLESFVESTEDAKETTEFTEEGIAGVDECPTDVEPEIQCVVPDKVLCASDLATPIVDAFGLEIHHTPREDPEFVLSLRDVADISADTVKRQRARSAVLRRSATPVEQKDAGKQLRREMLSMSTMSFEDLPDEAQDAKQAQSGAERDDPIDAIASLIGTWETSKVEHRQGLMRAANAKFPVRPSALTASTLTREDIAGESPPPSSSNSPRESNRAASLLASGGGEDTFSDSDHMSSTRSMSSASVPVIGACSRGQGLLSRLKMPQRKPKEEQIALQGGLCLGCKERLSVTLFSAPPYCHFTNCCYCDNCHKGDMRVIPARVAERWDFDQRRVCQEAAKFLDANRTHPFIPISRILQTKVPSQAVLRKVHYLRLGLTKIKEILRERQCDFLDPFSNVVASMLEVHVAEGHDLYSMGDLINIARKGTNSPLYSTLTSLVSTGEDHIQACETCQVVARHCPICGSGRPVYKFQVTEYHACPECQTVYHKICIKRADSECPRCFRLQQRTRQTALSDVRPR